eukprot:169954_1
MANFFDHCTINQQNNCHFNNYTLSNAEVTHTNNNGSMNSDNDQPNSSRPRRFSTEVHIDPNDIRYIDDMNSTTNTTNSYGKKNRRNGTTITRHNTGRDRRGYHSVHRRYKSNRNRDRNMDRDRNRNRDRDRDRDRDRNMDRDRDRGRDRDREHQSRGRDRSRSRHQRRDRSPQAFKRMNVRSKKSKNKNKYKQIYKQKGTLVRDYMKHKMPTINSSSSEEY